VKRIYSIDFTRGVVMIIMALDHVRDLMHVKSIAESPTDLSSTTPILFFTRWITYLCAPTFVFLAGTSAYISSSKKNDVSQSRKFLFKRGIWLIALEFTIMNFAIYFDLGFHNFIFEVIATIGVGFIILSLLLNLTPKTIAVIGLIIVFCHNLFPMLPFEKDSLLKNILSPFFAPGFFPITNKMNFLMAYPPIPWLGIMLVGFASGKLFQLPGNARKNIFIRLGVVALLLFVALRFINAYGDPSLWSSQKNAVFTFLSFMNVTKYPPSLLFCLVTLGIMFLILALGEVMNNRLTNIASVYGKTPLFYFIVHFYLIHISMIGLMFLQGFGWRELDFASGTFGRPMGAPSGLNLWAVYVVWIVVVLALYKPCLWFGQYKATHKQWWLKYI
jgi:uncharacterized membrane protein